MAARRHRGPPEVGQIAHLTVRGFGLLEVLIAMAVLASAGGMMLSWLHNNIETAGRLQRHDAETRLKLDAQSLLADLNPMLEPEGSREVAGITVKWNAQPLQPTVDGRSFVAGMPGNWLIGLYEVRVEAVERSTRVDTRFAQIMTGVKPRPGVGTEARESR